MQVFLDTVDEKIWLNVTDKIKSKGHEDRAGQGERQSDGGSMRVEQPKPGSSRGLAFTEASH